MVLGSCRLEAQSKVCQLSPLCQSLPAWMDHLSWMLRWDMYSIHTYPIMWCHACMHVVNAHTHTHTHTVHQKVSTSGFHCYVMCHFDLDRRWRRMRRTAWRRLPSSNTTPPSLALLSTYLPCQCPVASPHQYDSPSLPQIPQPPHPQRYH